jgi:DNA polymerase elongation subunit (family B)
MTTGSHGTLCGVWVDEAGRVHTSVATPEGGREERLESFRPFAWLTDTPPDANLHGLTLERLQGTAPYDRLVHAESLGVFDAFIKTAKDAGNVDTIRPWESQFLMQHRRRLYQDLTFGQLRRCKLDIETATADGGFPDAAKPDDRILAIGLRCVGKNQLLVLEEASDAAEKKLLEALNIALAALDPDVIEGHNIFKFDLDYLRQRCRRLKVPCAWGRFGQRASFRNSRLKVAERWIDFPRCDLPGRAVVDTYLLVQLYDITTRELTSFGLKEVAVHFGVTDEDSAERTYIEGAKIQEVFREDRARFCAYLEDDLRETQGLADQLLPTYFEQVRTFPTLLQEATLRGATLR